MSGDSNFIIDFLSKLNHPLEEVRTRALKNISNKIERCIINIEELCEYQQFIPYLLEWFNKDSVNHHDLVFKLIKLASATNEGAKHLLRVGGIEFLSQVRATTKSAELLRLIESILDDVFRMSSSTQLTSGGNAINCMYIPKTGDEHSGIVTQQEHRQTIGYFDNSFSSVINNNVQQKSEIGYKSNQSEETFKLSVHPIIPLTAADKKVLGGSLGTLQSEDFRVVISGIQFYADVILEDFPAPVFLQRQGAAKILIQFLSARQYSIPACKALLKLCKKLITYTGTCLDPNFFSTKNTFGIIKQESGGYEDECSWMCNELMDLHYEPNMAMPTQQPVPVFALQVITACLHQFGTLDTDVNWVEFFQLLFTAIRLLRICLGGDLRRPSLWELWKITDLLNNQFEVWAKLLSQYISCEDSDSGKQSNNRQVYLGLFSVFWELIVGFYSPEMALKYLPISAKMEMSRGLMNCCLGLGIMGEKMEALLQYVQLFDQNVAKLYVQSAAVMNSAESLIAFFLHNNEPIKYADVCISAASQSLRCLDHLYGARFCKEFVYFFSTICSTDVFSDRQDMFIECEDILDRIFKTQNSNLSKLAVSEIFNVVKSSLSVDELSKPKSNTDRKINFILRTNVFKSLIIYGLYNASPEIQETASTLFCRIWDSQGMLSTYNWKKVENLTSEHMLYLQPLADTTNRIGRQIMKLVLTFTEEGDIQMSSKGNEQSHLINVLAFCYNRKADVRKEACKQLEQFIRKDRLWDCKVNVSNMGDFLILSDGDNKHDRWFINGSSSYIRSLDLETENFQKVFDIYLSNNVDISVRKSAAEQLGIFLQMPNMHAYFISHGGLHFILDLIKGNILDKSQMSILIPSTVLILLRVVQQKSEIRETLRRDTRLIDNLFQMALYYCYDKQCLADVSTVLALIIFNSIIKQEKNKFEILMPDILIQRLTLPFRSSVYKLIEYSEPISILHEISAIPNQKWCYKDSFESNLRIQWNILKHGGLENYLSYKYSYFGKRAMAGEDNSDLLDGILECADKLVLTKHDNLSINNSIPQIIIYDNLQRMDNATNHCQVQNCLISVQLMLLLSQHQSINLRINDLFLDSSVWMVSIKKFLLNIPSCSADYTLLELTMDVLETIIRLPLDVGPVDNFVKWMVRIIIVPNNSLLYSLQKGDKIIGKTDSRRLTMAKNKLELQLPIFFELILHYLNVNLYNLSLSDRDLHSDIAHLHHIVFDLALQRLRQYSKFPFENLSMLLNWVRLMSTCLEMRSDVIGEVSQENISECCLMCSELIMKFQDNREEGSITFMGTSVIEFLLKTLIDLICDQGECANEKKIECAISQSGWLRKTPWLMELMGYRSVDIRALAVALVSRLVQFDSTRTILFKHCSDLLPDSLWYVALTLFCDTSEGPIVRSEAMGILQNLCAKVPLNNSLEIAFDEHNAHFIDKCTPVFVDHESETQFIGIEGLFKILLQQDFFRKIGVILTNFYTFPMINCSHLKESPLYDPERNLTSLSGDSVQLNVNRTLQQLSSNTSMNISTPMMVSSLMAFLCNLSFYVPSQMSSQFTEFRINTLIMNILDPKLLLFYLESDVNQHRTTTVDLISSYRYSVRLIRLQISMDSNIRVSFLIDEKFMATLIQLLIATNVKVVLGNSKVWANLMEHHKHIIQFQEEIIILLIALVVPVPSNDHVQLMITHITSHVDGVFECIRNMFQSKNKKTSINAMQFVSAFVSLNFKESKPNLLLSSFENQKSHDSDLLMIEELIELLLKKREKGSSSTSTLKPNLDSTSTERIVAHNTLKVLLGVSKPGKSYLVKVGFIDSAMVEIKYLHTKLDQCGQSKAMLHGDKSCSWKSLMKELISVLELLQNIFYDDIDAQNIGISAGFPNTIYRLWTLALMESDLMHSILSCLINFTADSSRSSKAVVNCHHQPQYNDQPFSVGSNVPLIENLCRLTSADVSAYSLRESTVRLLFRLLANLVWCPEAINLLLRCKFLEKYEHINPNQLQKSSNGIHIQNLWIGLITSLSFTEEGQSALMKGNGSAVVRILLLQNQIPSFRAPTALILRNLCTHPVIKVKLVVDGSGLVDSISRSLDHCGDVYTRHLALSALKALLYSNKKIRAHLKSANIASKLSALRELAESDANSCLLPDIITLINVFQERQEFRTK